MQREVNQDHYVVPKNLKSWLFGLQEFSESQRIQLVIEAINQFDNSLFYLETGFDQPRKVTNAGKVTSTIGYLVSKTDAIKLFQDNPSCQVFRFVNTKRRRWVVENGKKRLRADCTQAEFNHFVLDIEPNDDEIVTAEELHDRLDQKSLMKPNLIVSTSTGRFQGLFQVVGDSFEAKMRYMQTIVNSYGSFADGHYKASYESMMFPIPFCLHRKKNFVIHSFCAVPTVERHRHPSLPPIAVVKEQRAAVRQARAEEVLHSVIDKVFASRRADLVGKIPALVRFLNQWGYKLSTSSCPISARELAAVISTPEHKVSHVTASKLLAELVKHEVIALHEKHVYSSAKTYRKAATYTFHEKHSQLRISYVSSSAGFEVAKSLYSAGNVHEPLLADVRILFGLGATARETATILVAKQERSGVEHKDYNTIVREFESFANIAYSQPKSRQELKILSIAHAFGVVL